MVLNSNAIRGGDMKWREERIGSRNKNQLAGGGCERVGGGGGG